MIAATTATSFLLFFLSIPALLYPATSSCDNRRIHIRHLPHRFNSGILLNCSTIHPFSPDLCTHLRNSGLGPKTHNRSKSWYRTDHRFLEPFFHRRLLEYPCLVSDPSIADAVFLPYYAGLDALRFLYAIEDDGDNYNKSAEHGKELFDYLLRNKPEIWGRRGGHDHFLVMSRSALDFSQSPNQSVWGTSFLEIPEYFNVTALTLESRPWPWQEHAIPYPTSFHPKNLIRLNNWISRARISRRPTLILFAGSGGGPNSSPNIRRSIRTECTHRKDLCEVVDCSKEKCEHDPLRYMQPMLNSKFCLHPPGDTPTRRGVLDGIIAGCVPVFFEELTAKSQYGWHLDEEDYVSFSVFIPKEDVVFGNVKVTEVLENIPSEKVQRMRERVLELAPRVMYRRHGATVGLRQTKDAFDLAIDGVFKKIKERIDDI